MNEAALERRGSRSAFTTAGVLKAILPVYLVAIGACRFATIDPEAERTDLQEVCTVEGKWLSGIGPGGHAFPGLARFALLHDSRQVYWMLDAQNCAVREVQLPSPQPGEIISPLGVTNDDAILYVVLSHATVPVRYGLLDLSAGRHIERAIPQSREAVPASLRFSRDGRSVHGSLSDPMPAIPCTSQRSTGRTRDSSLRRPSDFVSTLTR